MRTTVAPGDVALTFDDGPDPTWTKRVAAALEQRGAVGTFFVEGPAARLNPDLVERLAASGHEVGLHCFEHVRHSAMAPGQIRADVEAGLEALASIGVRPDAWRTPWGDTTSETVATAEELGLELWGWSHDTHDWRGDDCAEMLAVAGAAGLRGGAVVLMHDGLGPGARRSTCAATVGLTEGLLELASEYGLSPTTLSASLTLSGP